MFSRRSFTKLLNAFWLGPLLKCNPELAPESPAISGNIVVSTWNNKEANKIAYDSLLQNSELLLDAVEKAVNSVENNPLDTSVGFGGAPDSDGQVTLDACIMDKLGNAGSVCYLKDIKNAVSVARKVMEITPHVVICGDGAKAFAIKNGFQSEDLLTQESKDNYLEWRKESIFNPEINTERHDTIGLLVRNTNNDMSGACSTSGLSYKMPGRVGDSPIIGSGLYVDNDVASATATGYGELIMQSCSTFLIVELIRNGMHPMDACKEAVHRISKRTDIENKQVGLLAIDKSGQIGAFALRKGFNYTVASENGIHTIESEFLL